MSRYPESLVLPAAEHQVGRYLSWAAAGAVASFLVFYVLTPWAYAAGPALLFLAAIPYLGFRWARVADRADRQSLLLVGVLFGYFLVQGLVLTLHGEDLSEYDLSARYLAAGMVLLFLLAVPVSGRQLLLMVGAGGILTGAVALYQVGAGSLARLQSFDNPIHFGNGALALAGLSLAGLFWLPSANRRLLWRALLATSVMGGMLASVLSGTRSGWIAVPVMAAVTVVAFRDKLPSRKWTLAIVLVLVPLLVVLGNEVSFVKKRMSVAVEQLEGYFEDGQNHTSVGLRLDMYKAGLIAFRESPLIGVGPTRAESMVEDLVSEGVIHPRVARYRHLHNQYIDNMARYGLIGLAAYIALLAIPFGLFYRKARSGPPPVRALGLAGALFVTLHGVVNLTQSMLERNIGVMMFAFVIVFLWAALKYEERLPAPVRESGDGGPGGDTN